MRKLFVTLLVLALAGLAAPRAEAMKGTVTIALSGEPLTFDPHIQSEFIGTMVWPWGYDNLIQSETGSSKLKPWLAEKLERLSAQAFKFTIRQGAKFNDGAPVTAEAVKYSIGRIFDPQVKSRLLAYFKDIREVEVVDARTVIIHTRAPSNGLPNLLRSWGSIMNPKTKDMDPAEISRNSHGSGPYVLKEWTKGQKMVFEANPHWWGNAMYPDRPKTLILRRIQEHTTRVKALQAGEVDIITAIPAHEVAAIKADPKLDVINIPGVRIMYVGFFTLHGGPFADKRVRQAVNHAVNTEQIIKTFLGGFADPFFQMLHPWMYSGYSPKVTSWYPYDLNKAKQLMKEAGYEQGFKAHLFTTVGRYPSDKEICESLSGMVKQIGVDAPCNPVNFPLYRQTFTSFQEGKRKEPAFYYQGFGNGAGDTAVSLRGMGACKGAWSPHCFKEFDDLVDKGLGTADVEEQQAALEKASMWLRDNVTHKPVAKIHDIFGVNKRVSFVPRHDEALHPWDIKVK
ncbi:MAG: ABC transporter substrate-binding protein [Nitrospinota bacterium]